MKQNRPLSYSALKQFDISPNHLIAYWNRDLTQSAMTSRSLQGYTKRALTRWRILPEFFISVTAFVALAITPPV